VLFGFVDLMPWGWRTLYAIGLVPLLVLAWWRRSMPETERFLALEREQGEALRSAPALRPIATLVRSYPGRLFALGGAVLLLGLATSPALFFAPKYLQDVHGWTPGWIAALNFGGGFFAVIGNPLAGWLSDRYGRRPITGVFLILAALGAMGLYAGSGPAVGALWVLLVFGNMGSEVTLAAYGAEMFPTSQRSTASGVRAFATTLGIVAGLAAVSVLFAWLGSNWTAILVLAAGALAAALVVWVAFPETAGRSLEEIAPEPERGA
jgi:predicted MFS family arabinose efflux permease